MKTKILLTILLALFLAGFTISNNEPLEIGEKAPMTDLKVKDVSGEMITTGNVRGPNGLLVMFSCNTCPWVKKWEDRYNPIANMAKQRGIGMIALNPNKTFRDKGDGFEDMVKRAQEKNYEFFYALDKDHKLADVYGATKTPEIFLFDKNMELVYHGAIDDNAQSANNVEKAYLKNALSKLANGEEIEKKVTKSLGCSIKRAE